MTTVFVCNRGAVKTVKVQLDLFPETVEKMKKRAETKAFTAKELMQFILNNYDFADSTDDSAKGEG